MTTFNAQATAETLLLDSMELLQSLIAKTGVQVEYDDMLGSFFFAGKNSDAPVLYLTPFWEGSSACEYSVNIDGDVIFTGNEPLVLTPDTKPDSFCYAYMIIANRLLAALDI